MFEFTGDHNKPNVVQVQRAIQVFLSKSRSWHGEDLGISVRTERVKDETEVKLEFVPKEKDKAVAEITGKKIASAKLDETYKIDWAALKEEDLKELKEKAEIVVRASIDEGKLGSKDNPTLIVDLDPPLFSA